MPHPASWSLREVSALYFAADGSGTVPVGDVEFRLSSAVVVASAMGLPTTITVPLESDGGFTVELPTTDDPDVAPSGLTWEVHEHIPGGRAKYSITVPAGVGAPPFAALQLADLAPVIPPSQVHLFVRTVNGMPANPATGDVLLPLSATLPPGGALGQALRKLSATNGDAGWAPHEIIDPTTGVITHTFATSAIANPLLRTENSRARWHTDPVNFEIHGRARNTGGLNEQRMVSVTYGAASPVFNSVQSGALNRQYSYTGSSGFNTQSGSANDQSGFANTQSGGYNYQTGYNCTQSGWYNHQRCGLGTQSGAYNTQVGVSNTQSGRYGLQIGKSLNDGGFNYVPMFGLSKNATVTKRAYFALDNGAWFKPMGADAATPEQGVLGYRSDLKRFRAHDGTAMQSLAQENAVVLADETTKYVNHAFNAPVAAVNPVLWQDTARTRNSAYPALFDVYEHNKHIGGGNIQRNSGYMVIANPTPLVFTSTQSGNGNTQIVGHHGATAGATQSGSYNHQACYVGGVQTGTFNMQVGNNNTQSAPCSGCIQWGYGHTQSGQYSFQAGYTNTQAGSYSTQSGGYNTQAGDYGLQAGKSLNDGNFNYVYMLGLSKTATVTKRAYFALDNGIWLKPMAGDAASPEDGVLCYNSTTGKFRGYAAGAWVDLH